MVTKMAANVETMMQHKIDAIKVWFFVVHLFRSNTYTIFEFQTWIPNYSKYLPNQTYLGCFIVKKNMFVKFASMQLLHFTQ